MALSAGTRLGSYEIVGALGAGGMGEVYRARDTQLKREVALKVLPEGFSQDPDRLARFQREAELLATLNHPNIAAVYGLEKTDRFTAIVLELVEGKTLADLIARGPLAISDALPIARQIADALEAAHEKGVIHRDLKPANIKITPDDKVKVLDFGLAKMLESEVAASSLTMSPTLGVHATYPGIILGTAAYMSPEQARGKPVDRRTDIWAFGCVVFEMLTARPAFDAGETVSDAIAAILSREPGLHALPIDTPVHIRALLRRCLEKDPRRRLRDIGDARLELEEARLWSADATAATDSGARWRGRLGWSLAAAMTAVALALSAVVARHLMESPPPPLRLTLQPPEGVTDVGQPAISPDARRVVYVGLQAGARQLWLQSFDSPAAQPLAGTNGGGWPFWSPDGQAVAFFAEGKLKKISVLGGAVQTIADVPAAVRGSVGAWAPDGTIILSSGTGPLQRVGEGGGSPGPLTKLESEETSHRTPSVLPDGRHFVFESARAGRPVELRLASLDAPTKTVSLGAGTDAAYVEPGYLVFLQDSRLLAQRLDLAASRLIGDPVVIAEQVAVRRDAARFGVSSAPLKGALAFVSSADSGALVWYDRSGRRLDAPALPQGHQGDQFTLSPDGSKLAIAAGRAAGRGDNIWIVDLTRGGTQRLALSQGGARTPHWSPDGARIAFEETSREGYQSVRVIPTTGLGEAEEVTPGPPGASISVYGWTPDGKNIFYTMSPQSQTDEWGIWIVPVTGDRKPMRLVGGPGVHLCPDVSPNGRWLAFCSFEPGLGKWEVYVQEFPHATTRMQISAGGRDVHWRGDSRELYYVDLDGKLMAVEFPEDAGAKPGRPLELFQINPPGGVGRPHHSDFLPAADGQRFLVNTATALDRSSVVVLLNWAGNLTARGR